jgi:hypothetical protein
MILPSEKLRKVSSSIFQELESQKNRSRPLEWQRGFNTIGLPLRNIEIVTSLKTHDKDWDIHREHIDNPTKLIKPDVQAQTTITAFVNEDFMRDRLYCAALCEHDEQKDIFALERPRGDTKVILTSSALRDKGDLFPNGVYPGTCFHVNYGSDEEHIAFEMSLPDEQMKAVIAELQANTNVNLRLNVHLLSFSYEVDDFLREHYHRRDLFIHEDPCAFVSSVVITSEVGEHSSVIANEPEELDSDAISDELQEPSNQEVLLSRQLKALLTLQEPLSKILFALWILIIAVTGNLFFR